MKHFYTHLLRNESIGKAQEDALHCTPIFCFFETKQNKHKHIMRHFDTHLLRNESIGKAQEDALHCTPIILTSLRRNETKQAQAYHDTL